MSNGIKQLAAATFVIGISVLCVISHRRKKKTVVAVIPARFNSSRFPGKPLALIEDVPMIVRTWRQATQAAELDYVVIATDDTRIFSVCKEAGAEVIMTGEDCQNGTIRCWQAIKHLGREYDIVVNIQGDEPCIDPNTIDRLVLALKTSPTDVCSTACTPLSEDEAESNSNVKVVLDANNYALYFSRSVIPRKKDGVTPYSPRKVTKNGGKDFLLHLGIYAFQWDFFLQLPGLSNTPLMKVEDLEQLKILEHGHKIKVITVPEAIKGVDEPEDIPKIIDAMRHIKKYVC